MSIKALVAKKINDLRDKIHLWESPSASLEQKRAVLASLVGNDPEFWGAVAKVASRDHNKQAKKSVTAPKPAVTAEPAVIATPPALKPDMPAPAPASTSPAPTSGTAVTNRKPLPATGPARTLGLVTKTSKPGVSNFGAKLNGAAKEVGFEDHSVLGILRKVLADKNGKGIDYWKTCRGALEDALRGADLAASDWKIVAEKLKINLFATGKVGQEFVQLCPKEHLSSLLLDQDGLTGVLAQIRAEDFAANPSQVHAYRVAFILDAATKVGHEASTIRTNCMHAINRMRQLGYIGPGHWLHEKVVKLRAESLAQRKPIPQEKFASPENVPAEVPASTVPVVFAPIEENGDKPVIEPAVAAELAVAFLAAEATMTEEELERVNAPKAAMAS